MKKFFGILLAVFFVICLSGCGKEDKKTILNKLDRSINNVNGYKLDAKMELINNEDVYKYDVSVSYKKKDNYRVSLRNQTNNHEQIILKNTDGVYVLTPSLNKSFKFQSKWPYNNSQSYLLQSVINDIKNDPNYSMKKKQNNYVFESSVNFKNNHNLVKQKVTVDKNGVIKKVVVVDKDGNPGIKVIFDDIDLKARFDKNYFVLEESMKTSKEDKNNQVAKLEEPIYPMYLPEGTYLDTEKTINTDEGERKILTFAGSLPFMLIEEPASYENEMTIIPTSGDLDLFMDTIAVINDTSINWVSNGIEYYLVSTSMDPDSIMMVARSISTMPVSK